jgi:hypothetical protein
MNQIKTQTVYQFKDGVIIEDMGDNTGVIFDTETNKIYTFNQTAFFIAKLINGVNSVDEILNEFYSALDKSSLEEAHMTQAQIYEVCLQTIDKLNDFQVFVKRSV